MGIRGIPEKRDGIKVHSVAEMVRSYRLTRGFTQADLSIAIGSNTPIRRVNVVQVYESGRRLPNVKYIYALSEVLGLEREPFFNMVLREHYDRFSRKHHEKFIKATQKRKKGKKLLKSDIDCRYLFCLHGKINHNFFKSSAMLKNAFLEKGITYEKLITGMENYRNTNYRYCHPHLSNIMNGKEVPSIKVILDLCEFLGLRAFEVYKVMVEEKALGHARNMMLQWNKYKIEREKDDNIVEEANRFQMA